MTEIAKSGYKRFGRKLKRTQRLILREVTRTAKQTSLNTLFIVLREGEGRKKRIGKNWWTYEREAWERGLYQASFSLLFLFTRSTKLYFRHFFKLGVWRGTKTCFLRSHKILRWIWLITSNENLIIVHWEVITIKLNIYVYSWLPM